ncbi:acyl-CoA reductase-like NAD-dependent aldehyde dehydrogenase [Paraburkholderia sp. GAS448]|uniref:aldehyde dehydrogenase family protein n=1 Tax=Paraburkholderia sp. GAS448 TaxID=3035136 RepID=UPI003D1AF511
MARRAGLFRFFGGLAMHAMDGAYRSSYEPHTYHPNGPFGGYKMSGYGREQGAEALESYTPYKSIWANIA